MTKTFFVGGPSRANRLEEELVITQDQLEEAREAAARADKTAEGLYQDLLRYKECAEERLAKIRRQEQTIQTLENKVSRLQDDNARLRGELNGANSANAKLRGTRDEIRRKLLERIRKDLLAVYPPDGYVLVSDVDEAIGWYLKEVEAGVDP